ncbi:hypothetical protein, partial [Rubrivivax albus]|uniref:hypothetical protein n=1 Tax=Rubrivivax albus TaxID=2499835 RepID=UPI001E3A7651
GQAPRRCARLSSNVRRQEVRPFLISYDLPVAPPEDAVKAAARRFNAAFDSTQASSPQGTDTEVFLVLREVRGPLQASVRIKYDRRRNLLGIDCPLKVHVLEKDANSVLESLAITLSNALSMAKGYCAQGPCSVDFESILCTINQVVQAERGKADA